MKYCSKNQKNRFQGENTSVELHASLAKWFLSAHVSNFIVGHVAESGFGEGFEVGEVSGCLHVFSGKISLCYLKSILIRDEIKGSIKNKLKRFLTRIMVSDEAFGGLQSVQN